MSDLPPADWYPDPEQPGQQRYWDGTAWTEHRAPLSTGVDPAAGEAAAPAWDAPAGAAQPGQPGQPAWGQPTPQQGWGQPGQPAWGQPGQGGAARTNSLAIASLVIGLVSLPLLLLLGLGALTGIAAIVTGIIGIRQVGASAGAQTGKGMAIAGIATGALALLLGILFTLFIVGIGSSIEDGTFFEESGIVNDGFFDCIQREIETGEDLGCEP